MQLMQLTLQVQVRYPVASCGLFVFDWTIMLTVKINFKLGSCEKQMNGSEIICHFIDFRWVLQQ